MQNLPAVFSGQNLCVWNYQTDNYTMTRKYFLINIASRSDIKMTMCNYFGVVDDLELFCSIFCSNVIVRYFFFGVLSLVYFFVIYQANKIE